MRNARGFAGLAAIAGGCAVVLTAACAPDGDEGGSVGGAPGEGSGADPVTVAAPVEMHAPAGEGSGEPHLALGAEGLVLSWLEETGGGAHALRMSVLTDGAWSPPTTVVERDDFFVNWADFPSVEPVGGGVLVAHWLQRGGSGTYDYGVRVAHSTDGGKRWSEPWTPHEDGTATEHGFVSIFPLDEGWGLVWLDGRNYQASPTGGAPSEEMTLRFRSAGHGTGVPGEEMLLDGRICDCCQTDVAVTARGPVAVYRDRSPVEIRDIAVTRLVDGAWTEGAPVHDDGWEIGGCPVNGPAVAARGEDVVVAWFTGAGDEPRVNAAFSHDAGATFGAPVRIDGGNPSGRVDVELLPDGSALVSWLERTGAGGAEVRVRSASPGGVVGPVTTVALASEARASGFPQMIAVDDGSLVFAWTDVTDEGSAVRVARAELPERRDGR